MKPKFVFWDDINKPNRYGEVIPNQRLGRVILRLYERIKNNTLSQFFSHAELEAVYWEVNPTKERKTREATQDAIERLKRYFLSYDSNRQEYHLRDYAYKFGEMVYTLLEDQFNPTQVERLCKILSENLEKHITNGTFEDWHNYIFKANHSDLRRQLDLLDGKINDLVKELGLQRVDDEEVLQMLRSVSERLERLMFEYKQLDVAYRDTRFIRTLLTDYQFQAPDVEAPIIEYALTFFADLHRLLDTIRVRLYRIRPKIQQLFGVFQQANFRARTDQFIRYLFERSEVVKDNIMLPTAVPSFVWRIHKLQLWYFDVNRGLFPEPPQPRARRVVDQIAREKAFQEAAEPARRQDEAQTWLDLFSAELEEKGSLWFSDYFPRVYRNEPQRFDVTLRFAYLILRYYGNHIDWKLDIEPPIRQHSYPNLLILIL